MGNPLTENSNDLLVLDSRDLADPAIIESVRKIEKLGQEQYDIYVGERLVNQTKSVWEPIKKNNLALFSRPPFREKTKSQLQLASLKNDCSLFSRLYVASLRCIVGILMNFSSRESGIPSSIITKWQAENWY